MPYLPTAQSFLEQSALLISARPTTTRITSTYNIPHPSPPPTKYKPSSLKPAKPEKDLTPAEAAARVRSLQPTLTLKTYDPASGIYLKYKTDKAAEVGRLVASLGRCGKVMAALPVEDDGEEGKADVMEGVEMGEVKEVSPKEGKSVQKQGQGQGQEQDKGKGGAGEGGGGGKKKKKGKR